MTIWEWMGQNTLPLLLIFGLLIILALITARYFDKLRIPSIVTYMLIGLLMGPSVLNVLNEGLLNNLHFLTEATLGFVAFKIGLSLNLQSLRRESGGMVLTIVLESLLAFLFVTLILYWFTGRWPLSILFGALAPASAPAGTVAVIEQYRARGKLTTALYTVVGFDDALGIIIFGVALHVVKDMIIHEHLDLSIWQTLAMPFKDIGFSLLLEGQVENLQEPIRALILES